MSKKQPIDGSKCKPLTLQEAKELKHGQTVYNRLRNNVDGSLCRVKITGKVTLWKTRPEEISVPWKHGLYVCGYITHNNLEEWTLEDEPFARFKDVRVCPATGDEKMLLEYTSKFVLEDNELDKDKELEELICDIDDLLEDGECAAYELYERLPALMNNYAPSGYYYGTHEADGEWGFWEIREEGND